MAVVTKIGYCYFLNSSNYLNNCKIIKLSFERRCDVSLQNLTDFNDFRETLQR